VSRLDLLPLWESVDLDLYLSESPDLLRWWRAAELVGVSGRREREESESETGYQRSTREKRVLGWVVDEREKRGERDNIKCEAAF